MARVTSCVLALRTLTVVSVTFLSQYPYATVWQLPSAILSAIITMTIAHSFFRRVMEGLAAIMGGVVGAMMSRSAVVFWTNSLAPGPSSLFLGATVGGTIWTLRCAVALSRRKAGELHVARTQSRCPNANDEKDARLSSRSDKPARDRTYRGLHHLRLLSS